MNGKESYNKKSPPVSELMPWLTLTYFITLKLYRLSVSRSLAPLDSILYIENIVLFCEPTLLFLFIGLLLMKAVNKNNTLGSRESILV